MSVNYMVWQDLARSHAILVDEISSKKGGVQETSTYSNLVEDFVTVSFIVHKNARDSMSCTNI
jgi:hypothetical protein